VDLFSGRQLSYIHPPGAMNIGEYKLDFLTTGWPWVGFAIALVLLALLLFTDLLRGNRETQRWKDPAWLAWLALPLYMLHQVEEHGIDALGQSYAFRGVMCAVLGYSTADVCPITPLFFTTVNVGTVWGGGLISATAGRHRPRLAMALYGIPAINAITHIVPALAQQQYNPGLVTSIALFLPVSIWAIRVALAHPLIGRTGVVRIVLAGVAIHAVLIGSLLLFRSGIIGGGTLNALQLVNALVPLAIVGVGPRTVR
jgi:hypothetical protein